MFIFWHQRDANQNCIEILPQHSQNGHHQGNKSQHTLAGILGESSYTLLLGVHISYGNHQRSFENTKKVLLYDLQSSSTTVCRPERVKVNMTHRYHMPMFIAALFTTAGMCNQARCLPMDEENMVYRCNGVIFSHKEEWTHIIAGKWMELKSTMLSERNQTHKDKYHVVFFLKC